MAEPQKTEEKFPQASPCGGMILYREPVSFPPANGLWVGVTEREAIVGAGLGITAGGFLECKTLLQRDIGSVLTAAAEAYREAKEELGPVFVKTISRANFLANAQVLTAFSIRTPDSNRIHSPVYFGYRLSNWEQDALRHLTPTKERTKPIRWMWLTWTGSNDPAVVAKTVRLVENNRRVPWSALKHTHEKKAFAALAVIASQGRLWNNKV